MANFRLCLFTLSLNILTFTLQTFYVMSDEAMITDVCSKSPDPNLCQTCLHNDPTGTDKLYDDSHNLYLSTTDPALHDLLGECWTKFAEVGVTIQDAARILRDYGADLAKQTITENAMLEMTYCSDLFKNNPAVAVPKNITDEMNVVVTDCQIILAILNSIVKR